MFDMKWIIVDGKKVLQYRYEIGKAKVELKGGLGTTTYTESVFSAWQTAKEPED